MSDSRNDFFQRLETYNRTFNENYKEYVLDEELALDIAKFGDLQSLLTDNEILTSRWDDSQFKLDFTVIDYKTGTVLREKTIDLASPLYQIFNLSDGCVAIAVMCDDSHRHEQKTGWDFHLIDPMARGFTHQKCFVECKIADNDRNIDRIKVLPDGNHWVSWGTLPTGGSYLLLFDTSMGGNVELVSITGNYPKVFPLSDSRLLVLPQDNKPVLFDLDFFAMETWCTPVESKFFSALAQEVKHISDIFNVTLSPDQKWLVLNEWKGLKQEYLSFYQVFDLDFQYVEKKYSALRDKSRDTKWTPDSSALLSWKENSQCEYIYIYPSMGKVEPIPGSYKQMLLASDGRLLLKTENSLLFYDIESLKSLRANFKSSNAQSKIDFQYGKRHALFSAYLNGEKADPDFNPSSVLPQPLREEMLDLHARCRFTIATLGKDVKMQKIMNALEYLSSELNSNFAHSKSYSKSISKVIQTYPEVKKGPLEALFAKIANCDARYIHSDEYGLVAVDNSCRKA